MKKITVVTGGNRGMGFEICKQLAEKGFEVILTARGSRKGKEATKKLNKQNIHFFKLDVTNTKEIQGLLAFLKKKYKKIDVLINNAGVDIDESRDIMKVSSATIKETMDTNFYGPLELSRTLAPIIRDGGRIINISSRAGQMTGRFSISNPWRDPSYGISKATLNALTIKLALSLKNIMVNAISPGWVRTDMGGKLAPRSIKKGVETVIWLATESKVPTGKFFEDKKEIKW